jgi:hypothetical protein
MAKFQLLNIVGAGIPPLPLERGLGGEVSPLLLRRIIVQFKFMMEFSTVKLYSIYSSLVFYNRKFEKNNSWKQSY